MTKARELADLIAAGNPLADGAISVAEISDLTASAAELNNVAGINSSVQTQLNAKAPLASPTLTGTVTMGGTTYPNSDGTEGQVLTTNGSGAVSFADPAGGGSADFVASGAIANGDVVSLNSNGTVSVVSAAALSVPQSVGSPLVFESAQISESTVVYDPNTRKVIIAYMDKGNSNYGTAIVGTITGTSISFGSPAVFASATANGVSATYDTNAQKVVISYRDSSNSNFGTAVVGTVNGTSITFGSPVVYESAFTTGASVVYDTNAKKVVIAYKDSGNNSYGTAIVGTVNGTSITFGSASVFYSGAMDDVSATYDTNAQKVVISFHDTNNGNRGTAVVGTVSGTSITFGSSVIFESGNSNSFSITYDANAQKVVVAYRDVGSSSYGTAIVGTVSGTSITFGSPVVFESANSAKFSVTYDANAKRVVIAYTDIGNSGAGTFVVGNVSGTSISFSTPVVFDSSACQSIASTYDANAQKIIITYEDFGNSRYGTSVVMQVAYTSTNASSYIGVADGAISNSATGKITINGGVNEGQSSLAVGTTYYVADNGDLQTTNNGRKIGKAISATKLLVNSNMSGDEMNAYLGGLV